MPTHIVDPLFNLQRTEINNVVTSIEIESARPLTLTQDSQKADKPGYLFLAPTANVTLYGNEVTVSGKLEFPGRNVLIFARILQAESDGTTPPIISVNGPEQTKKKEAEVQNFIGADGENGKNERAPAIYIESERTTNGEEGWSGPKHRDKMDGKPGAPGEPGIAAGSVFICCEQYSFDGEHENLVITADGGRGGEGQQGQNGAKGGRGGDGAKARSFVTGIAPPTRGGNGGRGGDGGKGGQGGQGGKGGQIVFHCELVAEPNLTLSYAGGPGGTPGKPGVGGDGGAKGNGGRGGDLQPGFGAMELQHVDNGPDGEIGTKGGDKGPGDPAPASEPGSKSVTSGKLESKNLIDLVRVSHAHMLFEQARADYLVTEPADYSIQLVVVMSESELPKEGKNLIVIGLIGSRLRIRIFDTKRKMVLDRAQDQLRSQEAVAKFQKRFDFTIEEVIFSGQWSAQKQLAELSADGWHDLFVDELNQFSNGMANTERSIDSLNDDELAGALALNLFSRERGGDHTVLQQSNLDQQRNGLIVHLGAQFGYTGGQLWPLDNRQLVLLAKLRELTNGKADNTRTIVQLSTDDMIGALALALLLRETGVRDEKGLAQCTIDDQRNILIVEMGGRFHYTGEQMWPLTNQRLVMLAFRRAGKFKIGETLLLLKNHLLVSEEEQEELVLHAGLCTRYVDAWTKVGNRLVWAGKLLTAATQGGEESQKQLAGLLYQPAVTALKNHRDGLDYFGRSESYTPKLSFNSYKTNLTDSLESLGTIEEAKNKYFTDLQDNKNDTMGLSGAITTTDSHIGLLSERKIKIKKELDRTSGVIDDLNGKLNQDELAQKLSKFEDQIKAATGLSWQTFFNCLGMLSFMNVNEPRSAINTLTKVGGYASAGAMAASQLGVMINEGVTKVLNDSGDPVSKSNILTQVEVIKGDVRLQSEFQKRQSGFLKADTSKRLVVELDRFRSLIRQFYRSAPVAETLRKDLDEFIDTITTRNMQIDYFNSLLVEMRQLEGEIAALGLQKETLQGKLTKIARPGLPGMANFVSGLYEQAKAACISDLYKAFRAKAFWALEPYSGFYDLLGESPGAINHATLERYKKDLIAQLEGALENARATPNVFPKQEDTRGVIIILTPKSHKEFFESLLRQSWGEFELEPATKASTQPFPIYSPTQAVWCSTERPTYAPNAPNPFHGRLNVRLTKVRTWMVGMTTGPIAHSVVTTHLGREQFRRSDDVPYPARIVPAGEGDLTKRNPEYVSHKATPIPFVYDPTSLRYDPTMSDPTAFTPGSLTSKWVPAITDGDLGFPRSGLAALPGDTEYAPIGPFGKWRVTVRPEDNNQLNLAGLSAVVIEMHGFND
ncbi:MAG: hypothetical protein QM706_12975 [Nitrospira sp.]